VDIARRAKASAEQSGADRRSQSENTACRAARAAQAIASCRRRGARIKASAEVRVKRRGRHGFDAALRDVSAAGCSVDLIEACQDGDHVIARFPELQPLGARVCWTAGTTVGLEFRTPFHPAVFDSVLGRPWLRIRASANA
jgi:hypothetical protein